MTNDNNNVSINEVPELKVNSNTLTITDADSEPAKPATQDASKVSVVMKTSMGDISVELFRDKAPLTVENFVKLAKSGFYDGTKFHRVIKDFMIQAGDPNSKNSDWSTHGMGGPGYAFKDEFNDVKLVAGVLAMANSGPNTNGSQFFIVTSPATPWLDGKHTAFGRVTTGMDIVRAIENVAVDKARGDHPLTDVVVQKVVIE
ncbi:MAG: peptidylprolyl isomerase [bacterium]|nr:peptidylprolyl isomerase [bacterium]